MPNTLAYLVLLIWPIVCLVMFRKMAIERAFIWSILGGYLFLPPIAEFNLPLVPGMDKVTIPNLTALVVIVLLTKYKVALWPRSWLTRGLLGVFLLSVIPTVLTNGEPLIFEVLTGSYPILYITDYLPGLSVRDVGSVLIQQFLVIVPFLLARQLLATEKGLRELLLAFMIGGVIYSALALIEIRFSPQTNIWLYGFFQHSFDQMIRNGGFRPIVFLPHALWLALFFLMSLLAALAFVKVSSVQLRWKTVLLALYLGVVLILCKSLASLVYGIALTPLVLFSGQKIQIRVALVFAVVAVSYPMLRNFGVIPLDVILDLAGSISGDRQHSLAFRFDNEQQLLARAAEKPWFGWGGWGRGLIRHAETGRILSIPDGRWIIVFGTFGWLGYVAEFGLLALPIGVLWRRARRLGNEQISPYVGPLSLILGITMIDMLLNATLTPITWLTAGAIMGHVEGHLPVAQTRHPKHWLKAAPVMSSGRKNLEKRTVI